jgi:hypothetical protein
LYSLKVEIIPENSSSKMFSNFHFPALGGMSLVPPTIVCTRVDFHFWLTSDDLLLDVIIAFYDRKETDVLGMTDGLIR